MPRHEGGSFIENLSRCPYMGVVALALTRGQVCSAAAATVAVAAAGREGRRSADQTCALPLGNVAYQTFTSLITYPPLPINSN